MVNIPSHCQINLVYVFGYYITLGMGILVSFTCFFLAKVNAIEAKKSFCHTGCVIIKTFKLLMVFKMVFVIFIVCFVFRCRGPPVSPVFGFSDNRTIGKSALIGDGFSTKIAFRTFGILKSPFFSQCT